VRPIPDDRGATLVETLVAVVVLGTAGLAVIGSMYTSIAVSDVHRKQATAGTFARDYTEQIAGRPYVECGGPASYTVTAVADAAAAEGYATDITVEYWTGSGWDPLTCSSSGLQRVTVVAESTDGRATERSVVVVRQR
jgi:type II secretory pathway pseudopilin PulG